MDFKQQLDLKNIAVKRLSYIVAVLLICTLLPLQTFAHDGDPKSPDGVTAPPPPELPLPSAGQTLYHIDATQSQAQYSVQEKYVGLVEGKLVVGETNEIMGDVLVDWNNPAQSQLGMVTVNVEQLTSDSRQRDRQIRQSYLESTLYPEATFIPELEQPFPTEIAPGDEVSFVLHGYLTVHDVTILADWEINLTVETDRLIGQATTEILMSDLGVGPISIVGLLSTEDTLQLTLDFVALADGVAVSAVAPTASNDQPVITASDLLFSQDIQPILETNCVGCHTQGEIGYGVFPLETVADVAEYADDVALVVETDFMPPWSPSHLAPAFKNDRSLDENEKALLLAWIAAGAPTDVARNTPLENKAPTGPSVREDIVLQMPAPYEPTGELSDDYRCFLLDPQLPNGGFVTGSDVIPGDRRIVHHVIIFQAEAESRAAAEAKAAEDAGLGWQCFGGPALPDTAVGALASNLAIWAPGAQPWVARDGTGIFIPPNGLIVMQVHYNYAADFYPDQTGIVLQVEDADSGIVPLRGIVMVAPVEIPCPEGSDNAACDRDISLAQRDPFDTERAEQMFMLCDKEVADYSGQTAVNATSTCDWQIPVDGDLTEIDGHMHNLGKSLRVTLNPDGVEPVILQDLPLWDFNWQGTYQFETPIPVKVGDILRITCTWDNSQATAKDLAAARYITWGEGTRDEMCLNVPKIQPAPGFEDVEGPSFLIETLTIFPDWMPSWLKILWFRSGRGLATGLIMGLLIVGFISIGVIYRVWSRSHRLAA